MTTAKQAAREQQSRIWHMYIWTRQPFFHAVAQAESVDEARELLLEEIGGGDGSCPEREKAAKWVREQQPTIFHRSNAEFSLTDSAELREQEAYVEKLQKEIKELKSALDSAGVPDEPGFDEATEKRWQDAIYERLKKAVGPENDSLIDGGGTDSGDALDFTLTEIGQAIAFWQDKADSAGVRERQTLEEINLALSTYPDGAAHFLLVKMIRRARRIVEAALAHAKEGL